MCSGYDKRAPPSSTPPPTPYRWGDNLLHCHLNTSSPPHDAFSLSPSLGYSYHTYPESVFIPSFICTPPPLPPTPRHLYRQSLCPMGNTLTNRYLYLPPHLGTYRTHAKKIHTNTVWKYQNYLITNLYFWGNAKGTHSQAQRLLLINFCTYW